MKGGQLSVTSTETIKHRPLLFVTCVSCDGNDLFFPVMVKEQPASLCRQLDCFNVILSQTNHHSSHPILIKY